MVELVQRGGFHQHIVQPSVQGVFLRRWLGVCSERHDANGGAAFIGDDFSDFSGGVEPVHLGHLEIHENHFRLFVLPRLNGEQAVFGSDHFVAQLLDELFGHHQVDGVVVHHKDLHFTGIRITFDGSLSRPGRVGRCRRTCLRCAFGQLEFKGEFGPNALRAVHAQGASVKRRQTLDDGQSQTGPLIGGGVLGVVQDLLERVHDPLQVVFGNANAGVFHLDHPRIGSGQGLCRQGDGSFLGELPGVVEEVGHHLGHPMPVPLDPCVAFVGQVQRQLAAAFFDAGPQRFGEVGQEGSQIEVARLPLHICAVEGFEVEDVVDQT